jgi:two-component system, response regulator PdtaR
MAAELSPKAESAHVLLLVEDEVLVRTPVAHTLRGSGFVVVEAANADEAWSYLRTGAPVDLVFSDIQMPGSMDGVELARRIRKEFDHIVIILTSGKGALHPDNDHHFIGKPYRSAHVVETVISLLGQE